MDRRKFIAGTSAAITVASIPALGKEPGIRVRPTNLQISPDFLREFDKNREAIATKTLIGPPLTGTEILERQEASRRAYDAELDRMARQIADDIDASLLESLKSR